MTRIGSNFASVARLALGAMWLWSGTAKLRAPFEFASTVAGYRLLNSSTSMFVAATLPALEIFVGACLLFAVLTDGALLATMVYASSFLIAEIYVLTRGLSVHCGCFGTSSSLIVGHTTLAIDVAILVVAAALYRFSRSVSRKVT